MPSEQVETRVEYRVFEDFGEFQRIVRIPGTDELAEGNEYTESRASAQNAAGVIATYADVPVRIQRRTITASQWEDVTDAD